MVGKLAAILDIDHVARCDIGARGFDIAQQRLRKNPGSTGIVAIDGRRDVWRASGQGAAVSRVAQSAIPLYESLEFENLYRPIRRRVKEYPSVEPSSTSTTSISLTVC